MFWDNYVRLCNSVNKAPNVVAAEIGVRSSGTVTGWKNGAAPRSSTLSKLANYFGVSTSELLNGDSIKPMEGQMVDIHFVEDISSSMGGSSLSEEAISIARAFDKADQRTREMVRLALDPFGQFSPSDEAM